MGISKEVLHQTIAFIAATINIVEEGISFGWAAPTLLSLQKYDQFALTTDELSWLASIHELGKVVGPIFGALLVDRIGRKCVLMICASIFLLSWFAISISTSVLQICIARFIFGISDGMNDVTITIYFGENFSPKLRAIFYSITLVSFYAAVLVEFVIASAFPYRTVAAINAAVAFVGLVSMFFCRETPQYLLMKEKVAKAEENYLWLRGIGRDTDEDVEFQKMIENVEEERTKKTSFKKLLFARSNYRSLITVSSICSLMKATGGAPVLSYVTILFSSSGAMSPHQLAILFACIRLVVSSSLPFYVERFKRRTMIMVIFFVIAINHVCTAVLYYVHSNISPIPNFSWLIFGTVTFYASIYTILVPLVGIMRGELYPQSIKAFGGFLSVCLLSAIGFLTTKTFFLIKVNFGIHANFLLFAAMSFVGFAYTYFKLPETKGKMLVDIQKQLER